MITQADLKLIAKEKLDDAEIVLKNQKFDSAIYLGGYAIELTLKSRVCKSLKWPDFPESGGEFKGFASLKTHDFDVLLKFSGQEKKIKKSYFTAWNNIMRWNPELRYIKGGKFTRTDAEMFITSTKKIMKAL
ncbi:MAG: hypothetical protein IPP71_07360 [Bacteroidetes bacterium]|nr:hypothetical protein [Bacteroidota bacterium]